jgi:hypothetical protein
LIIFDVYFSHFNRICIYMYVCNMYNVRAVKSIALNGKQLIFTVYFYYHLSLMVFSCICRAILLCMLLHCVIIIIIYLITSKIFYSGEI